MLSCSARSNGSERRLMIYGRRNGVNGSCQTSKPWLRCSWNTTFQLSNRIPTSEPSSFQFHLAEVVGADVPIADVVAPENEDVRFLRHDGVPWLFRSQWNCRRAAN